MGLLGCQLRDRQVRHHRPRGVVAEVVRVVGTDERGQLGHLREGEERVVVAEEGLPVLAVLPPPRRPERDEVALGEGELNGDDVAGHARRVGRPAQRPTGCHTVVTSLHARSRASGGSSITGGARTRAPRSAAAATRSARDVVGRAGEVEAVDPRERVASSPTGPVSTLAAPAGSSAVASTSASAAAADRPLVRDQHDGGGACGQHRCQRLDQGGQRRQGRRPRPPRPAAARTSRRTARTPGARPPAPRRSCRSSPRTRPSGRPRRRPAPQPHPPRSRRRRRGRRRAGRAARRAAPRRRAGPARARPRSWPPSPAGPPSRPRPPRPPRRGRRPPRTRAARPSRRARGGLACPATGLRRACGRSATRPPAERTRRAGMPGKPRSGRHVS